MPLIAAARVATPRSVIALDRQFSFAGALTAADDLVSAHATVLLPTPLDGELLAAHLREADRVLALVGDAEGRRALGALRRTAEEGQREVEVVLAGAQAEQGGRGWGAEAPLRVIRVCPRRNPG